MPVTSALENVNKIGDPYLQKLQEFLANTGLTIGPAAPEHQQELNTLASATVGQIRPTPEMAIPQPAFTKQEWKNTVLSEIAKVFPKERGAAAFALEKALSNYPAEVLDSLKWTYTPPKQYVSQMGTVTGGQGGAVGRYFSRAYQGLVKKHTAEELEKLGLPKEEIKKFAEASSQGPGYWAHPPGTPGNAREVLDTHIHEGLLHHLASTVGIQNSKEVEGKIFEAAGQLSRGQEAPFYKHLLDIYKTQQEIKPAGAKRPFQAGIQPSVKKEPTLKKPEAKLKEEGPLKPREESHLNVALSEASKVVGYGRLKAKLTEMLGDVEQVNRAFERAGISKEIPKKDPFPK